MQALARKSSWYKFKRGFRTSNLSWKIATPRTDQLDTTQQFGPFMVRWQLNHSWITELIKGKLRFRCVSLWIIHQSQRCLGHCSLTSWQPLLESPTSNFHWIENRGCSKSWRIMENPTSNLQESECQPYRSKPDVEQTPLKSYPTYSINQTSKKNRIAMPKFWWFLILDFPNVEHIAGNRWASNSWAATAGSSWSRAMTQEPPAPTARTTVNSAAQIPVHSKKPRKSHWKSDWKSQNLQDEDSWMDRNEQNLTCLKPSQELKRFLKHGHL